VPSACGAGADPGNVKFLDVGRAFSDVEDEALGGVILSVLLEVEYDVPSSSAIFVRSIVL
jgi:hypothetical protein